MATVQFEKDYRSLVKRFKRPADNDTVTILKKIDRHAARLQRKDILPSERADAEKKVADAPKNLKAAIKAEISEIKSSARSTDTKEDERGKAPTVTPALRSLMDGLTKLERRVTDWCKSNGKPKAPVRMPTTDFAGDYARGLAKCSLKHSPAVLAALKKLDSAQHAIDVPTLYKFAKVELEKTLGPLETEARSADANSKAKATEALKVLSKVREDIKNYDRRVFLVSRLNG